MSRPTVLRSLAVLGVASLALAACSSSSSSTPSTDTSSPAAGSALTVGTLLPQTGSLAFLGPPEFAGVDAAVKDINDAGGVLGQPMTAIQGDSGDTTTDIASTTVDSQLAQGVSAIIGAASSAVSLTVIDKIVNAGVIMFSPANTSITFSTYPSKGLYFRTAPPDTFQGAVLGGQALNNGNKNCAILALQDPYGTGLAKSFTTNFTAGGGKVASTQIYDPKAASYESEVSKTKAANPDCIVLIGFDESKKILAELIKQGIGPNKVQLYLVDGNISNTIADGLPKGIMKGTQGTQPGADPAGIKDKLLATNPNLKDFNYGAESYDATTIIALAATAANSTKGADIAAKIPEVTAAGNTEVKSYKEGIDALAKGEKISYVGYSGATSIQPNGDPLKATMGVFEYGADNTYAPLQFIPGDVPKAS
jgi:branched-chain amino acid transport system substrate-binding protein